MLTDLQAYENEILNFKGPGAETKTYTAYSKDGKKYTIGSDTGIDFIEKAEKGKTITGGDGSSWVKRDDGSILISKNGIEYLYGASWNKESNSPLPKESEQLSKVPETGTEERIQEIVNLINTPKEGKPKQRKQKQKPQA